MTTATQEKRILACIDLTDEADEVLRSAVEQAEFYQSGDLHLISVVKPVAQTHGGLDAGAASILAGVDARQLSHAQELINDYARRYQISADRCHIKLGHPATEIRQLAQDLDVNLIVMGTHSRHGLGRLLGSTANAVLHGVPCNVMMVRIDTTQSQAPIQPKSKDAA